MSTPVRRSWRWSLVTNVVWGLGWAAVASGADIWLNHHRWQASVATFTAVGLVVLAPAGMWSDRAAGLSIDTRRGRLERRGAHMLTWLAFGFGIAEISTPDLVWGAISAPFWAAGMGTYDYVTDLKRERRRIAQEAFDASTPATAGSNASMSSHNSGSSEAT
jgi:hypothetical protein